MDSNYSYIAREQQCQSPTHKSAFNNLVSFDKPGTSVEDIISRLQRGPIAVNHYVPDDFRYYSSGVYDSEECSEASVVNHSSLLVGYSFELPTPYFLFKNSWGDKWGEGGYYRMPIGELCKNGGGVCKIASNGLNVIPVV